jgi:hypothetical protein
LGTKPAEAMPESLATLRSGAFPHWFNPVDLQRLQRNSTLKRGAAVSVEFVNGKHWSNAAWPA